MVKSTQTLPLSHRFSLSLSFSRIFNPLLPPQNQASCLTPSSTIEAARLRRLNRFASSKSISGQEIAVVQQPKERECRPPSHLHRSSRASQPSDTLIRCCSIAVHLTLGEKGATRTTLERARKEQQYEEKRWEKMCEDEKKMCRILLAEKKLFLRLRLRSVGNFVMFECSTRSQHIPARKGQGGFL